jgi:hypothetical protein
MFAPVYYDQPVYTNAGYSYSPSTVIDLAIMATALFVQPKSHQYYYGDYYDRRYEDRGFLPWYSKRVTRFGDDPLYAHYRSRQLRQDPDWDTHIDEQYKYRREHVDARPPQTLALQININTKKAGAPANVIIGQSLAEAAQSKTLPRRFTTVNSEERKQITTRGHKVREFQLERAKLETAPAVAAKSDKTVEVAQPVKLRFSASPVAAKLVDLTQKENAPPPMPAAPKLQAVESRGKQEKPAKVEAKTVTPQLIEKPLNTEVKTAPVTEKPKHVEAKPETIKPEATPLKTEVKTAPVTEKPKHVEAKPETIKPETTPLKTEVKTAPAMEKPKRVEAKPETIKPEATPLKTEVKTAPVTEKPKHVEAKPVAIKPEATPLNTEVKTAPVTEKPKRVEAKPETIKPEATPRKVETRPETKVKPPEVPSRPQTVEPQRELRKPETPKPNAPKPEVRSQKVETKVQSPRTETKQREHAPNTDENKNKKNGKK